jgi:coenzyme Q-binding protein COQ10
MPSFRTSRNVSHPATKMFDLVADVEKYPGFLPLCQALVVRRRSELPGGEEVLVADMTVGYKAVRESFTSRVTLDHAHQIILAEYIDGPFRSLENRWTFRDRPPGDGSNGSTVEFFITYEFRSRMLGLLMGSMFEGAFRRFAEAFEHRADEVYG